MWYIQVCLGTVYIWHCACTLVTNSWIPVVTKYGKSPNSGIAREDHLPLPYVLKSNLARKSYWQWLTKTDGYKVLPYWFHSVKRARLKIRITPISFISANLVDEITSHGLPTFPKIPKLEKIHEKHPGYQNWRTYHESLWHVTISNKQL